METEAKGKTHPPGHESHSVHICHKCGWTFPNPHPSAKHRRAHKKVCGKIDGLQLIYHQDKANSNEDVSDDDHDPSEGHNETSSSRTEVQGVKRPKEEVLYLNRLLFDSEPIVGGLRDKGGEVQGEIMDARSSQVAEVTAVAAQEPDHDLENSTSESTVILQPNDLMQGSQIRNPNASESETVNLDSGTHVQGHALPSTVGRSISDINAGSLVLEPEAKAPPSEPVIPAFDNAGHSNIDTDEVVEFSMTEIGPNLDAEGDDKNARAENPPSVCMLPDISTSDFSEIDSKLHKMGELTEMGVPSNLPNASIEDARAASSKDMVVDFKEPNTSGRQNLQNEKSPTIHLASTETEGDEYQGGLVGTAKVPGGGLQVDSKQEVNAENQGDMVEGCDQPGKLEKNPPSSTSEHILVQNVSETKPEFHEDNVLAPQKVSLTSSIDEAIGSTNILKHAVEQEADSGSMLVESIKMEAILTLSKQVQEDSIRVDEKGSKTMQEEFIVHENGLDGDRIDGGSQFMGLDSDGCAVEGLHSDELEVYPGTGNRESILNKATNPIAMVVGSSKWDATGNHLEENKLDCSFGELVPHHGLAHEILPGTLVDDAAGGSTSCSGVGSIVCNETAMDSGGYGAADKEFRDDQRDYSQERTKARDSPSSTEIEEQVGQNDTDNQLSGDLHQELKSNQGSVVGLHQLDMKNPTSEEHACSSSLSLENCSSRHSPQGGGSDSHFHSVQEGGDDNILKHNSNASALSMDASVNSISQTNSIGGYWGSVSDGTVSPTRDATYAPTLLKVEAAPNISIQTSTESSHAALKEHRADSTELFEAPSFMTLVEPVKDINRQSASPESHSNQKPQSPNSPSQAGWFPSLTNVVNDSQGRKKNEEIIAKVVNWSSGKTRNSLSHLLIEANLDSKHKSQTAPEHAASMTREGQVSRDIRPLGKTTTKNSTASTAKGVTNKEYSSPARLPVTKKEKRKIWFPFTCCPSIN